MIKKHSVTSILVSLLLLAGVSRGEEVTFQLKFEPGKKYLSQVTMDQSMTMKMGEQDLKTRSSMLMKSTQTVAQQEKGVSVSHSIDEIKLDVHAGGMEMKYDSLNPEGPMAAILKPLLEAQMMMNLDEDGKVLSVEAPAIAGMENLGMGKEEMEQMARDNVDMMANQTLKIGESWESTSKLPLGGLTEKPATITYQMTFAEMQEKDGHEVAQVTIGGTIAGGDENLKITSKKMSGYMLFDPIIGQSRETSITMDLEIGLPIDAAAADGAPATMPMTMTTVTTLLEVK